MNLFCRLFHTKKNVFPKASSYIIKLNINENIDKTNKSVTSALQEIVTVMIDQ